MRAVLAAAFLFRKNVLQMAAAVMYGRSRAVFYADLHIHSKYSRATSRDLDLENLAWWARKKGISVLGTGDFTHPAWLQEIREKLVPAEPGLFRLRPDLERDVERKVGTLAGEATRFMLQVEISTIYKKGDKTRKVHHLLYAPSLQAVEHINAALARIGNLHSDGRPILGLDSRNLLEITLSSDPGSYLIPAHIWTPWFSMFGSKSGFDAVEQCYGDLAPAIFALETGLSSDPEMNWKISALDRYRLVSNSDAHSPAKLGRETSRFGCDLDYFAIRHALETGEKYLGSTEFFPEEGKYHMDGHRRCEVRLEPAQTRELNARCPSCGEPLTVGVMHRVEELADRETALRPEGAADFRNLIPLSEILAETYAVGTQSKKVRETYEQLLQRTGPELWLLENMPLEDIQRQSSELLAEAIRRMREGAVIREAGYDGEYGVIRLFERDEIKNRKTVGQLFETQPHKSRPDSPLFEQVKPIGQTRSTSMQSLYIASPLDVAVQASTHAAISENLAADPEQQSAVVYPNQPLLIIAGPGTGKTRTLVLRLLHLIRSGDVSPECCLAITFTRRAAKELERRIKKALPSAESLAVHTFHSFGLQLLQEINATPQAAALHIASEPERSAMLAETLGVSLQEAERRLRRLQSIKSSPMQSVASEELLIYEAAMQQHGWVDYQDLILKPLHALQRDALLREKYSSRYEYICVDEFQDIDAAQYALIRMFANHGGITVIGDPNQAIYGFRGADSAAFSRFEQDFHQAEIIQLSSSYRCSAPILNSAVQVLACTSDRASEHAQRAVNLQSKSTHAERITVHQADTDRAEAEFVVKQLESMFGGHNFFSIDSGRSNGGDTTLSFNDIAVLYRTEAQSEAVAAALSRCGLPFELRSHKPLLDRPTARQLASMLETSVDQRPLRERAFTIVQTLISEGQVDSDEAWALLRLIEPMLSSVADVQTLIESLSVGIETDSWDPRAERISLMTLHASKGLEFKVVFIIACELGLLPLTFDGALAARDVEEERRLLYVGMTRAKTRLFLTHAKQRKLRGRKRKMAPSPFIGEIERTLVELTRDLFSRSKEMQLTLF